MIVIGFIFALATAAWAVLGTVMHVRTADYTGKLGSAVGELWGSEIGQYAPELSILQNGEKAAEPIIPDSANVNVGLSIDHRRKGLIWYPTYLCRFDAAYTIVNDSSDSKEYSMTFRFPDGADTYDEFALYENNERVRLIMDPGKGLVRYFTLGPGVQQSIRFAYVCRGMKEWQYRPVARVNQVRGLTLTVTTDFKNVDYVPGSLSPMSITPLEEGLTLVWEAEDLLTDRSIGIILPEKINPGPLTSRMTYFAPVCLFFFFVLIGTINIVSRVAIHPMHYLFVACGFFAFHLMLAYLIDVVNMHLSFMASSLISVGLVTFYLRAALGERFPWKIAAGGQTFFLVLFSYSFFVKGMTGLTVATGSVITLGVLMAVTAKLDWSEVFSRKPAIAETT
jgi:hypothetical protein